MSNITNLHPEKEAPVTLTGAEWVAIMLKLAGRSHDTDIVAIAESKMLRQLGRAK